jgi:hypothetical protein
MKALPSRTKRSLSLLAQFPHPDQCGAQPFPACAHLVQLNYKTPLSSTIHWTCSYLRISQSPSPRTITMSYNFGPTSLRPGTLPCPGGSVPQNLQVSNGMPYKLGRSPFSGMSRPSLTDPSKSMCRMVVLSTSLLAERHHTTSHKRRSL